VDWSAPLFEILVSTCSGAREYDTPARLDSNGRSVREGGILSACGWTFRKLGFHSCQGKILFVRPRCLHQLLDSVSLLSNKYRRPVPDVDTGRRECDDQSLFSTEVKNSWSYCFLAWGFFKYRVNLRVYVYLLHDYTKCYVNHKTRTPPGSDVKFEKHVLQSRLTRHAGTGSSLVQGGKYFCTQRLINYKLHRHVQFLTILITNHIITVLPTVYF